jgi:hypothetical protein
VHNVLPARLGQHRTSSRSSLHGPLVHAKQLQSCDFHRHTRTGGLPQGLGVRFGVQSDVGLAAVRRPSPGLNPPKVSP